jgi:hypothetical protein
VVFTGQSGGSLTSLDKGIGTERQHIAEMTHQPGERSMANLRVEELEPRQLLTCTGGPLPPPFAEPSLAGFFAGRIVDHVTLVIYDGHADLIGLVRSCELGTEIGPSGSTLTPGYGDRELEAPALPAPVSQGVLVGWLTKWVSTDHPELSPNATARPGNTTTNTGAIQLGPPEMVNSDRRGYGASAEAVAQIPSRTPILPALPDLGENPIDVSGPVKEVTVLPAPQMSDVLTILRLIDLSALEHSMQHFVDQAQGLGQRLGDSSGPGLYPWVAAVAAAALACEIGRRQLKQPAGLALVEGNHLAGFPPDESFAE